MGPCKAVVKFLRIKFYLMPTFRHEVAVDIKPIPNMLYMTWSELMATMAIARNKALVIVFPFFYHAKTESSQIASLNTDQCSHSE